MNTVKTTIALSLLAATMSYAGAASLPGVERNTATFRPKT